MGPAEGRLQVSTATRPARFRRAELPVSPSAQRDDDPSGRTMARAEQPRELVVGRGRAERQATTSFTTDETI